jgi:hypothetical protein
VQTTLINRANYLQTAFSAMPSRDALDLHLRGLLTLASFFSQLVHTICYVATTDSFMEAVRSEVWLNLVTGHLFQ